MLSGSEDITQIYSFIAQVPAKHTYKELIKFRKRANYLEMLIYLMQKALSEDLSQEINEWAADTLDWLEKRNAMVLGKQTLMLRKPEGGGAITIAGNLDRNEAHEVEAELLSMQQAMLGSLNHTQNPRNLKKTKPKIKKYKLLIPLELDIVEKNKLEEKQKKAIDKLYDLLPERYDSWNRRRKLRRILQDESAQKAQLFVVIGRENKFCENIFEQFLN